MLVIITVPVETMFHSKLFFVGGFVRSRLRGAAIVKLRHLMKTSILRLNELHPLQQTAAPAGGGGLYFLSMRPVFAEHYTRSDE